MFCSLVEQVRISILLMLFVYLVFEDHTNEYLHEVFFSHLIIYFC